MGYHAKKWAVLEKAQIAFCEDECDADMRGDPPRYVALHSDDCKTLTEILDGRPAKSSVCVYCAHSEFLHERDGCNGQRADFRGNKLYPCECINYATKKKEWEK